MPRGILMHSCTCTLSVHRTTDLHTFLTGCSERSLQISGMVTIASRPCVCLAICAELLVVWGVVFVSYFLAACLVCLHGFTRCLVLWALTVNSRWPNTVLSLGQLPAAGVVVTSGCRSWLGGCGVHRRRVLLRHSLLHVTCWCRCLQRHSLAVWWGWRQRLSVPHV